MFIFKDQIFVLCVFCHYTLALSLCSRVRTKRDRACRFSAPFTRHDLALYASPPPPSDPDRLGPETLSNRFLYKVNSLMGEFDPPPEVTDDETTGAASLAVTNALVNAKGGWPTKYDFVAVGQGESFELDCLNALSEALAPPSPSPPTDSEPTPQEGTSFLTPPVREVRNELRRRVIFEEQS